GRSGLLAFTDASCRDTPPDGPVIVKLQVVSPDGTGLRTAYSCDIPCGVRELRVEPNGARIAAAVSSEDANGVDHVGLWLVPASGGAPRELVSTDPNPYGPDLAVIGWE